MRNKENIVLHFILQDRLRRLNSDQKLIKEPKNAVILLLIHNVDYFRYTSNAKSLPNTRQLPYAMSTKNL